MKLWMTSWQKKKKNKKRGSIKLPFFIDKKNIFGIIRKKFEEVKKVNRNNSMFQGMKNLMKHAKRLPIYFKIMLLIPIFVIGFIFLYTSLYVEIVLEPVLCMVNNCDASAKDKKEEAKPTSMENKRNDGFEIQQGNVVLTTGAKGKQKLQLVEAEHQRKTQQAITDYEFKRLAKHMVETRKLLTRKYEEPVQYYGKVKFKANKSSTGKKNENGEDSSKLGDVKPPGPDLSDPKTGTMDGDKIAKEAYRIYEEHGVNSASPWRYSQANRNSPGYADCSSFTAMVYKKAMNMDIGSNTIDQIAKNAKDFHPGRDKLSELKPGDLMYFDGPGGAGHTRVINGQSVSVQHTAIYVGGNKFIDMDKTGSIDGISIRDIGPGGKSENYAKNRFIGYVRIGTPGTGTIETDEGEEVDEAELHLRALANTDWYALDGTDIFQRGKHNSIVMEDGKEKIKDEFKGTMVEKTWLVARGLREDKQASLYKYATKKRTDKWDERDWMLNARFIAYSCYFNGDTQPAANNLFEWIATLFDKGPCSKLNEILLDQSGGKYPQYIEQDKPNKIDDWSVLNHEHSKKEITWVCKPKPPEEEKKNAKQVNGTQKGTLKLVTHRSEETVSKKDCQYGYTEQIEEKWYADFPSLYSGEASKSVLKYFEKYSLIIDGKTVSKGKTDYFKELERIIGMFYGEALMSNDSMIVTAGGGTNFIVPMEDGTYNFASPFGPRWGKLHAGDDMGTAGAVGVPIYATSNGVVISTGWVNGYGYTVMIKQDNGYYSFYAHMQEDFVVVKKDQKVQQAQLVGGVGNVPDVPYHLHFEVCEKEVVSASGNLMCGDHVDPEDDDNSKDNKDDEAKLKFNTAQDMGKSNAAASKFMKEWKEKAKAGEVFIMPGYVGAGGGNGPRGVLSEEFESQKGECAIERGDYGGLSCGFYQFANNPYGQVCGFVTWLKETGAADYYNYFASYCPTKNTIIGSDVAFKNHWNAIFARNGGQLPADFKDLQWRYAKMIDYDPVVNRLKKTHNFDVGTRHIAVQEMIWSMGMQQPGLIPGIFNYAGYSASTNWASVNDRDLITKVYDARYDLIPSNFKSSPGVWPGLRKRFLAEKQKALALLGASK